jgi:hypothetical protein
MVGPDPTIHAPDAIWILGSRLLKAEDDVVVWVGFVNEAGQRSAFFRSHDVIA